MSISYSGIVLEPSSQAKLLAKFRELWGEIPGSWKEYGHHMTIKLGPLKGDARSMIGQKLSVQVLAVGGNEKVFAAKVNSALLPDAGKVPHITLATNPQTGGKPAMSNAIDNWESIPSFDLEGTVEEVENITSEGTLRRFILETIYKEIHSKTQEELDQEERISKEHLGDYEHYLRRFVRIDPEKILKNIRPSYQLPFDVLIKIQAAENWIELLEIMLEEADNVFFTQKPGNSTLHSISSMDVLMAGMKTLGLEMLPATSG